MNVIPATTVSVFFLLLLSLPHVSSAAEPQTLQGENGFGNGIAAHGAFVAIGDRDNVVKLYERDDDGVWELATEIDAPGIQFDSVLEMDDGIIVGGAATETVNGVLRAGAVYVLEQEAGSDNWRQTARLTAEVPIENGRFGSSAGVDGNRIVVVGKEHNPEPDEVLGVAYVFARNDATLSWEHEATLDVHNGDALSADISGNMLAVASRNGLVRTYRRDNGEWTLAPEPFNATLEGAAIKVRIEGDVIAVAAPYSNIPDRPWNSGQLYLYEISENGNWDHVATFQSPNPDYDSAFGYALDLNDGLVAVAEGSRFASTPVSFIGKDESGAWVRFATLNCRCFQYRGERHVAVSASALAMGGPGEADLSRVAIYDPVELMAMDEGEDESDDADDENNDDANGSNNEGNSDNDGDGSTNGGGDNETGDNAAADSNDEDVAGNDDTASDGSDSSANEDDGTDSRGDSGGGASGAFWVLLAFAAARRKPISISIAIPAIALAFASSFAYAAEPVVLEGETGFGTGVAIDGARIAVGGGENFVTIYTRDENGWHVESHIDAAEGPAVEEMRRFGYTLGMHGNTIVAASTHETVGSVYNAGAVYVFERGSEERSWRQTARLVAPEPHHEGRFGLSVDVDDGRIAVVGRARDEYRDWPLSTFLFEHDEATLSWKHAATFNRGRAQSVDVEGDRLVIGTREGFVFTYDYDGTQWRQAPLPPRPTTRSVKVQQEGDVLAVAAQHDIIQDVPFAPGRLYVYESSDNGIWSHVADFHSPDPRHDSVFGVDFDMNDGIIGVVEGSNGTGLISLIRKNEDGEWVRFATPPGGMFVAVSAHAVASASPMEDGEGGVMIYDTSELVSSDGSDDEDDNAGDDEDEGDDEGDDEGESNGTANGGTGEGNDGNSNNDSNSDSNDEDDASDDGNENDASGDEDAGVAGNAGSETGPESADGSGGGAFGGSAALMLVLAGLCRRWR